MSRDMDLVLLTHIPLNQESIQKHLLISSLTTTEKMPRFLSNATLLVALPLASTLAYSILGVDEYCDDGVAHTQASVQPWSNLIAIYLGKAPSKLQSNLIKSIPNLKFVHLNMKDHMNSVGPLIVRQSAEPTTDQHTVN